MLDGCYGYGVVPMKGGGDWIQDKLGANCCVSVTIYSNGYNFQSDHGLN